MVSETLQAACDNAIRCSRRGDTRTGIDLARHAYRLARQESPEAELEALNASALCQSANGSFIESIATSIDVISLARQQLNRRSAAFALATMAGAASFILDANSVVLEMLQVCRSEADALTDVPLKVRIHNHCCPVKTRIDSVGCTAPHRLFCNRCLETLAARASSRKG